MNDVKHFFARIRPVREDFLINWTAEDEKIMGEHFQYLKQLLTEGKLIVAGPITNEKKPFGIIILKCDSLDEAKEIMKKDPSVISGIQNLELVEPFRLSLYKPAEK